ncbi:MAG: hypothetical protein IPH69_13280 [Bacteroidales bacterium]|nr:hypothetical protein [Bacteroidales bacterium]
MTVSDLKLRIFRQIDSLEKNKLEEFYGLLMNYINGQRDISDWDKLTEFQKKGILDAIDEVESGKEFPTKLSLINSVRNTQMPKPILWSPLAEDDFANILDYLEKYLRRNSCDR